MIIKLIIISMVTVLIAFVLIGFKFFNKNNKYPSSECCINISADKITDNGTICDSCIRK